MRPRSGGRHCVVRQRNVLSDSLAWFRRIPVDPLILRQGEAVDLKVEIVWSVQRQPTQRGSLVAFYLAFPLRDREIVKLPELR